MAIDTGITKVSLLLNRIDDSIKKGYNENNYMRDFNGHWRIMRLKKNRLNNSNRSMIELVFDYEELNEYSKYIADHAGLDLIISFSNCDGEKIIVSALINDKKQNNLFNYIPYIFFCLLILSINGRDNEKYLARICDLAVFFELNNDDMYDIVICVKHILDKNIKITNWRSERVEKVLKYVMEV